MPTGTKVSASTSSPEKPPTKRARSVALASDSALAMDSSEPKDPLVEESQLLSTDPDPVLPLKPAKSKKPPEGQRVTVPREAPPMMPTTGAKPENLARSASPTLLVIVLMRSRLCHLNGARLWQRKPNWL